MNSSFSDNQKNSPIAGVIMECNPFHDGHRYLLQKAREVTGADAVIVVLSGDFAQRGIPTVYPMEQRVRDLLEGGADLVLELPVCCATAGAEYFARGGVHILAQTGIVTDLVFGSETGDLTALTEQAQFLLHEPEDFRALLRRYTAEGLTFPAARTRAAAECSAGIALSDSANDVLAVEYLRSLWKRKEQELLSPAPHPVLRIRTASASERRSILRQENPASGMFPDDFSGILLGRLLSILQSEKEAFSDYAGVSPDLANRIQRLLPSFVSWTQFCELLKTRNLTYTSVSRALTHLLLGIREEDLSLCAPSYARVLGCRREALPLIGEIQRRFHPEDGPLASTFLICRKSDADTLMSLPGFSHCRRSLSLDLHAEKTYELARRLKAGEKTADETAAPASCDFARPFLKI